MKNSLVQRYADLTFIIFIATFIILLTIYIVNGPNFQFLISELGGILTGFGAIAAVLVASQKLTSLRKQRFIESINMERRKWLNELRTSFNEYFAVAEKIAKFENGKESIEDEKWLKSELSKTDNYIRLLINPTEPHLIILINLMSNHPFDDDFNKHSFYKNLSKHDWFKLLEIIMQVVLKTEWKIIKIETKDGKEVNETYKARIMEQTTNKIFKNTDFAYMLIFVLDDLKTLHGRMSSQEKNANYLFTKNKIIHWINKQIKQ